MTGIPEHDYKATVVPWVRAVQAAHRVIDHRQLHQHKARCQIQSDLRRRLRGQDISLLLDKLADLTGLDTGLITGHG